MATTNRDQEPTKTLRVLHGETSTEIKTTSSMTGKDIMKRLSEVMGISRESMEFFGLCFEVPSFDCKIFVNLEDKIWKYNYRSGAFFNANFSIKFFVRDLGLLDSKNAREMYYDCVRCLLKDGDIQFPEGVSAINVLARILQKEFGDFDATKHTDKYFDLNDMLETTEAKKVLKKYPEFEANAAKKFHFKLQGVSRNTALTDFFRFVMRLPTYGIVWSSVDRTKGSYLLGIKSSGLVKYSVEHGVKIPLENINWKSVLSIKPDGKKFIVQLKTKKKFTFTTKSSSEAKYLFELFRDSAETYKVIYRRQKALQKPDRSDPDEQKPEEPPVNFDQQTRPHSAIVTKSSDDLNDLLEIINNAYMNNTPNTEYDMVVEFQQSLEKESTVASANKKLNRYSNVLAYDETRVKIPVVASPDEYGYTNVHGYINANHVKVEMGSVTNNYVCCQGPKNPNRDRGDPGTLRDFWTMVLVMKIKLIVMTTNLVEANNRVKCAQYWPSAGGDMLSFGPLTVEPVEEDPKDYYTKRKFLLTDTSTGESMEVMHMQYTNWPDHGIPSSPANMNDFVSTIQEIRQNPSDVVCVHCSAGIGRTGVTVMVDMMMSLLKAGSPVSIIALAKQLRSQRAGMIQTREQYEFLYNCLEKIAEDMIRAG